MKRKFIVIALLQVLLFVPVGILAKSQRIDKNFQIGIKGGIGISSCSGFEHFFDPDEWGGWNPTAKKGSRTGAVAGGFIALRITDNLLVQPEFLYLQAGCKRDFNINIHYVDEYDPDYEYFVKGKFETKENIEYFEIPILFKYIIEIGKGISPYLIAGPSIGINIKAKFKYNAYATFQEFYAGSMDYQDSWSTSGTEDVGDYVKGTNFIFIIGAGLSKRINRVSLFSEVRYSLGLTNIMDKTGRIEVEPEEYIYLDEAKTRTFSFILGIATN